MVYEFANERSVSATPAEREYLRLWKQPPAGWNIFAGYYAGIRWKSRWNHRAGFFCEVKDKATVLAGPPNFQTTVAVLGNLVFQIVSGSIDIDLIEHSETFRLRIIWPEIQPSPGAPAGILDDDDIDKLAAHFGGRVSNFRKK